MSKQSEADRFRQSLDELGMTHLAFGTLIGRTERTIRRYAAGDTSIPQSVWMAIEQLQRREARR